MVYMNFWGLLVESYGTWLLLQRLVDASKDSDIPKNVPFALAINNRNTRLGHSKECSICVCNKQPKHTRDRLDLLTPDKEKD